MKSWEEDWAGELKKKKWPPTLSEYLLREASRFPLFYPMTGRRTPGSLAAQEFLDGFMKEHSEWRKTFAPRPIKQTEHIWNEPHSLNDFYCRELLRQVPEIVARDRKLSQMILSEIKDPQSFVYLREAANCYILGLPQAAIALSRAAIESRLKIALAKNFGKKVVIGVGLYELINDFAVRGKPPLLSPTVRKSANKVREAGDDVLRNKPADSGSALEVIEAAKGVVLELEGKRSG